MLAVPKRCAPMWRTALSQFDISDLMDDEDPSTDSDVATVFMLVQRGEARLGGVEEALDRLANGTHGYCIGCGCCFPLVRLRSSRSTVSCIDCSRRSSQQNCDVLDRDCLRAEQIRGRSLAGCGVSGVGGEQ